MRDEGTEIGAFPAGFRPTHVVVHYDEVALKGKNRKWFEGRLASNVRRALALLPLDPSGRVPSGRERVSRRYGRILVGLGEAESGGTWRQAVDLLRRVFGIAYMLPVLRTEPDLGRIRDAAGDAVRGTEGVRTFAVKCRRATKDFPFTSMDVQREVGAHVGKITGWTVDLRSPDSTLRVECVNDEVFLGFGRIAGAGGLPTGVAGRVACLLSGGIDSPVAAYRLLRRGATAVFVHFHSHPHTGLESQDKVRDLANRVRPPGTRARIYMVPFADLQRRIAGECPASLRILMYRRFMVRATEAIARKEGALALVTGENLGQVASQTLENLWAIDAAASLPVLRPLIGLDKREIIEEARRIGTFEVSIEPHDDCCSFLMPTNPATRSTPAELAAGEERFEVAAEVARMVETSAVEDLRDPVPARREGPEDPLRATSQDPERRAT